MKLIKHLFILFLIFTLSGCCAFYGWRYKLNREIKNETLHTYYARTSFPNPIDPSETKPDPWENQCGKFYRFEVKLSTKANDNSCKFVDDSKVTVVETTRLKAVLQPNNCVIIVGAYNNEGILVARKITDLSYEPDVLICDW
jgi:hypothetical protein